MKLFVIKNNLKTAIYCLLVLYLSIGCSAKRKVGLEASEKIDYCTEKIFKTGNSLEKDRYPVYVPQGDSTWLTKDAYNWTSGFWPGLLWYAYEYSQDEELKKKAESYTLPLEKILLNPVKSHDLDFIFNSSCGHAYRLTGNSKYKEVLLIAADSLSNLYNPNVGTILS